MLNRPIKSLHEAIDFSEDKPVDILWRFDAVSDLLSDIPDDVCNPLGLNDDLVAKFVICLDLLVSDHLGSIVREENHLLVILVRGFDEHLASVHVMLRLGLCGRRSLLFFLHGNFWNYL